MSLFRILELKPQKPQSNSQEDIFIQKASQERIESYVLTIVFTEELLQQFLLVIAKKQSRALVLK